MVARLRHFAIVVRDLEKSAKCLRRRFRPKASWPGDIGVRGCNLLERWCHQPCTAELLLVSGALALRTRRTSSALIISASRSMICLPLKSGSKRRVVASFSISATMRRRRILSASSRIQTGLSSTSPKRAGSAPTAEISCRNPPRSGLCQLPPASDITR